MKLYLISIAAGVLVGIIYGILNVRSPAPPVVALLGLLGMLLGEQAAAAAKRSLNGKPLTMAWVRSECAAKILGAPVGCNHPSDRGQRAAAGEPERHV